MNIVAGFIAGSAVTFLSFLFLSKSIKSIFSNKFGLFVFFSLVKYLVLALLIVVCILLKLNMFAFVLGIVVALIYFVILKKRKSF
jgi:hypothetical protein